MKAHKTCACGIVTHVSKVKDDTCPACGTIFPAKDKKPKRSPTEIELTLREGRRGYRLCLQPACGLSTSGPRSQTCIHCDHSFDSQDEAPEPDEIVEAETEYHTVSVYPEDYEYPENLKFRAVYAAAGECPFRLRSNNEEKLPSESAIRAWAFRVRQEMMNRDGCYLTNEALLRWASNEVNADLRFGRKSEEMQYLRDVINTVPDIKLKKVAV